jgi:TPR repeat protein
MNKLGTVRNLLFAALSLAVVGSGVWYFTESRRAAQASDNLAAQQLSLANTQVTVKRLQKQLKQLQNPTQTVSILPKSADQPGLLRELENAQKQNHVTVASAAFTNSAVDKTGATSTAGSTSENATASKPPATAAGHVSSVEVTLQVTGSPDSLLGFVHSLQSDQRVTVVKSFDLSLGGQKGTLSLVLNFPYQP